MVVVDPTSRSYFYFIGMSVVGLGIGGVLGLAINEVILTVIDVAIGFSRLFL